MSSTAAHLARALALAAMFFFPLTSAIDSQAFYLHWQPAHGIELALAFLLLALALALALAGIGRLVSPRLRLALGALLALLPAASMAFQVASAAGLRPALLRLGEGPGTLLAIAALAVATLVLLAWPERCLRLLEGGLVFLSPLAALFALTLLSAGLAAPPPPTATSGAALAPAAAVAAAGDVVVLVFDELSYTFLYRGDGAVRADCPQLAAFAAEADNYHQATSPGDGTMTAMPGLLATRRSIARLDVRGAGATVVEASGEGRPLDLSGGLLAVAQSRGYRTYFAGWLFPYCRLLGPSAEQCHDYSAYNFSTLEPRFSPLHPLLTTLMIWPHQLPFGLLKGRVACRHQRLLAATMEARVAAAFAAPGALFAFVHLSLPHAPFAFDAAGYAPTLRPYLTDQASYLRQLAYTDVVFGRLRQALERQGRWQDATVAVLSDHEYRSQVEDHPEHVPLLIKRPGQSERRDLSEPSRTEEVIRRLLEP